jgi:putative ABC transport system permease protein
MNLVSLASLAVGIETLRANPLRTMLSTLGVIIGVGALVAILSLGDGLEQFSRSQIELTTDLQTVSVTPRTVDRSDGVLVRRTDVVQLSQQDIADLAEEIRDLADVTLTLTGSAWARLPGDTARYAALVVATLPNATSVFPVTLEAGRFLEPGDYESDRRVVVLSPKLAMQLSGMDSTRQVLGQSLDIGGSSYEVVGIVAQAEGQPQARAIVPLVPVIRAWLSDEGRRAAMATVKAYRIEQVPQVRDRVESWLKRRFGSVEESFAVASSEGRVAQARQAFLVFKLTMGCITGISLVVGGIGIMNILLASVVERTREIGVRRAAGARGRDILLQFLAEAIAISSVGSFIGVILGMVGAFAGTAVIRAVTDAPVNATFTWPSIAAAVGAALLIGLVFGTYPARRAASLTPIEAIRHE